MILELLINFSVVSAMSPVIARVSGTYIWDLGTRWLCQLSLERRSSQSITVLLMIILLHCNYLTSFDNFLAHENEKFLSEIKESFVIMRDKPSLNRNISSAPIWYSILKISVQFTIVYLTLSLSAFNNKFMNL